MNGDNLSGGKPRPTLVFRAVLYLLGLIYVELFLAVTPHLQQGTLRLDGPQAPRVAPSRAHLA